MSKFLFIQSQDPFTHMRCHAHFDLATRLSRAGNTVKIFLVQNGVLIAREGSSFVSFDTLAEHGIEISADKFSLRQREIPADELKQNVKEADIDNVITAMLGDYKVIWN